MGLCVNQNVLRRAAGDQLLQNKAVTGVLSAGIQLSVGKRTRAALSKLHVGADVQLSGLPEPFHIRLTLLHGSTPFQKDRLCPGLCQHQRGKQPRRSRAYYHRRKLRRGHRSRQSIGRGRDIAEYLFIVNAAQDLFLIRRVHRHGVYQFHVLPGVHASAQDINGFDIVFTDPQKTGGLPYQIPGSTPRPLLQTFNFKQIIRFLSLFFSMGIVFRYVAVGMDSILSIKDLNLWYGDHQALHSINAEIPANEITALIGPSGCGKSTFLKTLNRMNDLVPGVHITGEVSFQDQNIYDPAVDVTGLRRRIGMKTMEPCFL